MFYVAFIVDHDIHYRNAVVVEAGVDLLAGPYPSRGEARSALRTTCALHPRLAAFAALATFIAKGRDDAPVRIEIIPVSETQLVRYNAIHAAALPWPPPVLMASQTKAYSRPKKVSIPLAK